MNIELEAKFIDQDHDLIRSKLKELGAELKHPMRLMKRHIMDYPDKRLEQDKAWIRVRDEGDKVTLTYKCDTAKTFGSVEELETSVGDLKDMLDILKKLGLVSKSYQETRRETWKLADVYVELDEWPFIPPFIEIEGTDKESIKQVADKLGLDWEDAVFGSVTSIYKIKYPHLKNKGKFSDIEDLRFDSSIPDILVND